MACRTERGAFGIGEIVGPSIGHDRGNESTTASRTAQPDAAVWSSSRRVSIEIVVDASETRRDASISYIYPNCTRLGGSIGTRSNLTNIVSLSGSVVGPHV